MGDTPTGGDSATRGLSNRRLPETSSNQCAPTQLGRVDILDVCGLCSLPLCEMSGRCSAAITHSLTPNRVAGVDAVSPGAAGWVDVRPSGCPLDAPSRSERTTGPALRWSTLRGMLRHCDGTLRFLHRPNRPSCGAGMEDDELLDRPRRTSRTPSWMGAGVAIGVGVGVALAASADNAVWIGVGAGVGVAIATAIRRGRHN